MVENKANIISNGLLLLSVAFTLYYMVHSFSKKSSEAIYEHPYQVNKVRYQQNSPLRTSPEPLLALSDIKPESTEHLVSAHEIANTQLSLKLRGIVNSSDKTSSGVIISVGDRQGFYKIGSLLPVGNKAYLSAVFKDHVLINNAGQYEYLWLYEPDAQSLLPAEPDVPIDAAKDTAVFYGQPSVYAEAQNDSQSAFNQVQALAEVNQSVADSFILSAYPIEGTTQLRGYKVEAGRDSDKFKATGLEPGDIVTAINGIPITKPEEILDYYKNKGDVPISFEVERGEAVVSVDIP